MRNGRILLLQFVDELQEVCARRKHSLKAIALAPIGTGRRREALQRYDQAATELVDQYLGLPVDEGCFELLRQSIEDMREVLRCCEIQIRTNEC